MQRQSVDRRAAEEAAHDPLLEVALSVGGAGRWEWDLRVGSVGWDRVHALLFGQAPEAFGGTVADWLALVHPDDRGQLADRLYRAVEQHAEFDHTYRVLSDGGGTRWVLSRGRMLARQGDPQQMAGLSIDVTAGRLEAAGAERLLEVSTALGAATTPEEVASAVTAVGLAPLGLLHGQVVLREGARLVAVATAPVEPERGPLRPPDEHPVNLAAVVRAVIDGGVPVLPGRRAEGSGSAGEVVCLPLQTAGRTIGALSAQLRGGGTLAAQDQRSLLLLAGLCAQALDRAVLHRREAEVAHTLQRQLLPDGLPTVAGLELTGTYLAGTKDLTVGGDWYDAISRSGEIALVVGDVVGKGLAASALMSRARHTVNAYALVDPRPSAVLQLTDRLVEQVMGESEIVTVMYALLRVADGALLHSSAGHPPPLVVAADGTAAFLPVDPQPPLGTGWGERTERKGVLAPGSVLLLYSDGLVEERGSSLDEGLDTLRAVAAEIYSGPAMPLGLFCDELVARVLEGARPDDVTLLAARLRVPGGPNEPGGGRPQVPIPTGKRTVDRPA